MEHPDADLVIKSMPKETKVKSVKMLGNKEKIKFYQQANGTLVINKPNAFPDYSVVVFEIK